jgi:hypothetical protein
VGGGTWNSPAVLAIETDVADVRVGRPAGKARMDKPDTSEKGACGGTTTEGDCGQLPRECLPPPQAAGTPAGRNGRRETPNTHGSLAFRVAKSVQTHCMEEKEGRTLLRQLIDDRRFVGRVAFWMTVVVVWSVLHSLRRLRLTRARLRG